MNKKIISSDTLVTELNKRRNYEKRVIRRVQGGRKNEEISAA